MQSRKYILDYIFWILVVFYMDPGGMVSMFVNLRIFQSVSTILILTIFLFCMDKNKVQNFFKNKFVRGMTICFIAWFFYYMLVFLLARDQYSSVSLLSKIVKTRIYYSSWLLVIPIAYFISYRNQTIFFKVFSVSTIIIGLCIPLNIFAGIDLIILNDFSRGFVNVDRYMMGGYGLLEWGLYILFALLVLPQSGKNYTYFFISTICYLIYTISLTRRYFFYVLITAGISYLLSNYLFKNISKYKSRFLIVGASFFLILYIAFNEYALSIPTTFSSQSINYGTASASLSLFSHSPTVDLFQENIFFGTGYINEWYSNNTFSTLKVQTDFGLEGSDYVFLSSLAMFGLFGICLFIPFYLYLVKTILFGFKLIKNNFNNIDLNDKYLYMSVIFLISTGLFFIRHMITYPDWFAFIGPHGSFSKYYILLGILLGSLDYIYRYLRGSKHEN